MCWVKPRLDCVEDKIQDEHSAVPAQVLIRKSLVSAEYGLRRRSGHVLWPGAIEHS